MGTGILIKYYEALYKLRRVLFFDKGLHKARFAGDYELRQLLFGRPLEDGLLIGRQRYLRNFVMVRPSKQRREIGNMLIVAPTRGGKGLLATSQLLSWK